MAVLDEPHAVEVRLGAESRPQLRHWDPVSLQEGRTSDLSVVATNRSADVAPQTPRHCCRIPWESGKSFESLTQRGPTNPAEPRRLVTGGAPHAAAQISRRSARRR